MTCFARWDVVERPHPGFKIIAHQNGRSQTSRGHALGAAGALEAFHGAEVSKHLCIMVRGVTKYVPVAPFDIPDFADLGRMRVAVGS